MLFLERFAGGHDWLLRTYTAVEMNWFRCSWLSLCFCVDGFLLPFFRCFVGSSAWHSQHHGLHVISAGGNNSQNLPPPTHVAQKKIFCKHDLLRQITKLKKGILPAKKVMGDSQISTIFHLHLPHQPPNQTSCSQKNCGATNNQQQQHKVILPDPSPSGVLRF
jgi:hypothetical protein